MINKTELVRLRVAELELLLESVLKNLDIFRFISNTHTSRDSYSMTFSSFIDSYRE